MKAFGQAGIFIPPPFALIRKDIYRSTVFYFEPIEEAAKVFYLPAQRRLPCARQYTRQRSQEFRRMLQSDPLQEGSSLCERLPEPGDAGKVGGEDLQYLPVPFPGDPVRIPRQPPLFHIVPPLGQGIRP